MDAKEEALSLVNKIWVKLQNLADGNPVDLGAFFIILTFMLTILLMVVLTCVSCCCSRRHKTKMKDTGI